MAQLVKLADYISRYETDLHRYSSRYPRLKTERWERLKHNWETERKKPLIRDYEEIVTSSWGMEAGSVWKRMVKQVPFLRRKNVTKEETDGGRDVSFNRPVSSLDSLARSFREELYQFQLSWASSTISETSAISSRFEQDTLLARMVKDLPDTYFILYSPVFRVRQAEVELGVIIITPVEIWLLQPLDGDEHTIYSPLNERFWNRQSRSGTEKIIHPGTALKRMASVVKEILQEQGHPAKLKPALVAKNSFIDIPDNNRIYRIIDKRSFPGWFEQMRKNHSPIKSDQLKVTNTLLDYCVTYAAERSGLSGESAVNEERGGGI
ncbi:hypothetical protein [Alteribacter natronophilus]|uniref:hypothetical protein n=1 Tax=Alteribacter natronophilus TaxID=2583810 RepID=UPI00110F219B|nr:hypothetical protein [Alteribacter natronophilus]TMW71779.1 hypothetical protein FGB90_12205 [Alteribacter natronophilus]